MNSSVSALTTLSPNVQAVALPSATARTALERLPSPLELKARQPLPLGWPARSPPAATPSAPSSTATTRACWW